MHSYLTNENKFTFAQVPVARKATFYRRTKSGAPNWFRAPIFFPAPGVIFHFLSTHFCFRSTKAAYFFDIFFIRPINQIKYFVLHFLVSFLYFFKTRPKYLTKISCSSLESGAPNSISCSKSELEHEIFWFAPVSCVDKTRFPELEHEKWSTKAVCSRFGASIKSGLSLLFHYYRTHALCISHWSRNYPE